LATHPETLAPSRAVALVDGAASPSVVLAAIGLVALALSLVVGVAVGTVADPVGDTVGIIAHRLFLLDVPQTWSTTAETIVWDLRLPRVLEAMIVGLGLAVAGTTFQGLLRNPLADPYVLGTASGAALGRRSRS
jgi:iron complex transport system permease protein